MATITFKGSPIQTTGNLPAVGTTAPDFSLTGKDLAEVNLATFAGKKKVLSIVPSLDTGICAMSAKAFNAKLSGREDVVALNVSADLPFASSRFCDAEKLEGIVNLSTFRSPDFGTAYGMTIAEGPLRGLLGRAVLVLDESNTVVHSQLVPEIAQEPDYDAVLAAL
ncbi:MAG TPA: thiol peroxidase [Kiritimatiellia bacterium]|nr:thiol peroxidase [Kiritimatiellia bacterium]